MNEFRLSGKFLGISRVRCVADENVEPRKRMDWLGVEPRTFLY